MRRHESTYREQLDAEPLSHLRCIRPRSFVSSLLCDWFYEKKKSTNLCPFRAFFFNFGKCRKSQEAEAGERGVWSVFVTDFIAWAPWTHNTFCARALSWWRIYLSDQSSGLSPYPCQHFQIMPLIIRLSGCNGFVVNHPRVIEETKAWPSFNRLWLSGTLSLPD